MQQNILHSSRALQSEMISQTTSDAKLLLKCWTTLNLSILFGFQVHDEVVDTSFVSNVKVYLLKFIGIHFDIHKRLRNFEGF